jgi:CBS domain-containing protein
MPDKKAFLRTVPPFDHLDCADLANLSFALSLESFADGQAILQRWEVPAYLYIVVDGVVEELDTEGPVERHTAKDIFDTRSLFEGRTHSSFIASGGCRCYRLAAQQLLEVLRRNPVLETFFRQAAVRKLDTFVRVQQQREAAPFMMASIGDGTLTPPLFISAETPLGEAAAIMKTQGRSAVLIRRDGQVGIFTSQDVREQMVLAKLPESTPVGEIANYELITLDSRDYLFNALVAMTRYTVRHVVIRSGDEIVGVLEQRDLLDYIPAHSHVIADQIERARSSQELREASDNIALSIKSLHTRGVKPRYISRLATELNRTLFRRLFELLAPSELLANACLIVMGSEGRGEQLLRTDQDNALILRSEDGTGEIASVAKAFTEALVALGYPPCPGNIMVSNPAWAKSLAAYKEDLLAWVHEPDENAYLNLAIFYDASTVIGDASLLNELKGYLFRLLVTRPDTVRYFARSTLAFPTPLGVLNRFVLEKTPLGHGLDIKKGGLFPIIHGVRSLALESRLAETGTIARIQALVGRRLFDERFTADLIEAFEFMSMLRLRAQLASWERGEPLHNYITPKQLSRLERNLLKSALKVVRELKTLVSYHFKLDALS